MSMTSARHQSLQGSILEIEPRRSIKSSPASSRKQSGRQSRTFSHSLDPKPPSSNVGEIPMALGGILAN
jgi:hypothetical protein